MVIRLTPQPGLFDTDVELVRISTPVPVSAFYLRRPFFIPWSVEESVFILETSEPSAPHTFVINRTETLTIVPGQSPYTLSLQMAKGANRIEVSTPDQTGFFITVAATAVESWFNALGREYYLSVGRRLEDIQNHYLTPWTTRVSAHLLPFTDLFLPARMPKVQQTRLAILTAVGQRLGYGDGVRNMATALSYSTPPVSRLYSAENAIPGLYPDYPGVTTHPTTGEASGRLLDLWSPNICLASHQALFKMVLAIGGEDVPEPKPLALVDKGDRQIIVSYGGGPPEVHFIDPEAPECDDIEYNTSCDASVRAFAEMATVLDILMSSPQLPLDETVESPINFGFFDEGAFFDASTGHPDPGLGGGDTTFDTVDQDDPFGDGFLGFSLSRRFDAPACLDTRIQAGQRMSKFTSPIVTTSPPALTPEPPTVEGIAVAIDAGAGAPTPIIGATTFWGVCARTYLNAGDHLRFELPDLETKVVSAYPVLALTGPTGAAASMTATAAGVITVTGLTGMTAAYVGQQLTIAGTDNPNNNGSFIVVAFNSASSVDIADGGVAPGADANNGTLTWVAPGQVLKSDATTTSQVGSLGILGTVSATGRITATGLTGMLADSTTRYLTISGTASADNAGTFPIDVFNSAVSVDIDVSTGQAGTAGSQIAVRGAGAASMGAVAGSTITVTGLVGMTASAVGRTYLTISGAANAANNGTFLVTAFNSAVSVDIAAGAAPGADANNGGLIWAETNSVAAAVMEVTGLAGMAPESVGQYLTLTGAAAGANNGTFAVAYLLSPTSVYVLAGVAPGGDANNGALVWVETIAPGSDANSGALSWMETVKSTGVSFSEVILTGPVGFFEQRHEGKGVEISGAAKYSIVRVEADGSQATLSGNPTALPAGAFITNVYEPLRDRSDTSEPSASISKGIAGRATYEFNVVSALVDNHSTGDIGSYRVAPRAAGAISGASATLSIMSDTPPLPGDLLYFDSSTSRPILSAIANGTHHTTRLPLYDITLNGVVTPGAYVDDAALFSLRADACWLNGDPVTPLMVLSLDPGAYLTY